ncbi:MAG: SDR family oxidoreductase [Myxococcaceae bacterium]|nr:SDR family oxidoreductase [Myxococcaceae bacterium]
MKRLQDKVVVITGGGSGIGAATATLFAQEGAKVLVVGRTAEKLRKTVQAINNENVSYSVADVSKVEDTQRYVADAVERYGGIDVLVSNAGFEGSFKPITEYTVEEFDEVMAINVRGSWLAIKHTFPELQKRGGGSVIITASIMGLSALGGNSAYVTAKHAAVGLMRTMALEGAPLRIRVNAVCPGFIDNDMMATIHSKIAPGGEALVQGSLSGRVPLKRYGTSEEVARLNLFLASSDSSYITGSAYTVDGGTSGSLM